MAFLSKISPLLNKLIPTGLAIKGLSKVDPKLATFVSEAALAGYGADSILDYLRNRLGNQGQAQSRASLEAGEQTGGLHPEQKVALNKKREEDALGRGLAGAIGIATGIGGIKSESRAQQPPPIPPPTPPLPMREQERKAALQTFNQRKQKPQSPISASALQEQFANRADQQGQGKAQLLQTLQQLEEHFRRMSGNE